MLCCQLPRECYCINHDWEVSSKRLLRKIHRLSLSRLCPLNLLSCSVNLCCFDCWFSFSLVSLWVPCSTIIYLILLMYLFFATIHTNSLKLTHFHLWFRNLVWLVFLWGIVTKYHLLLFSFSWVKFVQKTFSNLVFINNDLSWWMSSSSSLIDFFVSRLV